MKRPNRRLALSVVVLSAVLVAGAGKSAAPKLIPADTLDIATFLPPPPAGDSAEGKAELAQVLRVQHDATDAEKARAKSEKKLTMAAFTPVVGPWFTAENLPQTAALLKQLEADSKYFTAAGKEYFKRVRPCDVDAHVAAITQEDEEFSYPSGHSTRGTLYAGVLCELMPELKEKLLARSQEIGWDRIIAGVHYPSDIVAGRVLGGCLARAALANPAVQKELQGIRAELTAAREKAAAAPVAAH